MEEKIDHLAVIQQLQLENEALRRHMKAFAEVRDAVYSVPELVAELWQKVTTNKMRLLVGLMIIYWAANIALLVYDRWPTKGA